MKWFFFFTAMIELLAGVIIILLPQMVTEYQDWNAPILATARMHGVASITMGIFALLVWIDFDKSVLQYTFLVVFTVYHVLIALTILVGHETDNQIDASPGILHAILGVFTLYFLYRYNTKQSRTPAPRTL